MRPGRSGDRSGVTAELMTLEVRSRRQWRAWLTTHHTSSSGIWLIFYKHHTGLKSMPYDDAVREALCFGWIDSLVKRLDDNRYAVKVTPRKPTSKWSDINRRRWKDIPNLPNYIAKAIKANAKAWKFFRELAPTYRRNFVVWIHTAKRPDTRERRIRQSLALLAAGKKLGLK